MSLPSTIDHARFRELHGRDLPFWRSALERIRRRHGLPAGAWLRAPLGRNVVFSLESSHAVKLVPPFWREQADREAAALQLVAGRLPVRTPTTVAAGELDGWRYLVLDYLAGRVVGWNWEALLPSERLAIARQSGMLAAQLHALEVPDAAAEALHVDWSALLAEQHLTASEDFAAGGLAPGLIDAFPDYLATAGDLAARPYVLLQGDLSPVNLIVAGSGADLVITGLLDFGDARLGPFEHEFISPVMHFFRGEGSVLEAFYRGYRLAGGDRTATLERRLMARSALCYASILERYRRRLPEADTERWDDLARAFWRLAS